MSLLTRRSIISASIAAALFSTSPIQIVSAQEMKDAKEAAKADAKLIEAKSIEPNKLETITVTAKSGAYRKSEKGSASALAPTQASLDATQPQSIITREFIESSVAPTAEYSRVVNVAPSMSGDSANGPGLSETKTTMRGFSSCISGALYWFISRSRGNRSHDSPTLALEPLT